MSNSYLIIKPKANEEQRKIINAYWLRDENEQYIIEESQLASHYGLNVKDLKKLVARLSTFHFSAGYCMDCGEVETWRSTKERVDIGDVWLSTFFICDPCYRHQEERLRERQRLAMDEVLAKIK